MHNIIVAKGGFCWASNYDDVRMFLELNPCTLSCNNRFGKVVLVDSFRLNNHTYESLNKMWCDLNLESFNKNAFSLFTSVRGEIHLLGIYTYLFFFIHGAVYIQALVYEIPSHPCLPIGQSHFSRLVDLASDRQQTAFTLVSLHRLQMETMYITPVADNEIYLTPNTTTLRQWKVFQTIEYLVKNNL